MVSLQAVLVDAAIYNCVLDVCMSNGAMQQAENHFSGLYATTPLGSSHGTCLVPKEMQHKKLQNLITYNTPCSQLMRSLGRHSELFCPGS